MSIRILLRRILATIVEQPFRQVAVTGAIFEVALAVNLVGAFGADSVAIHRGFLNCAAAGHCKKWFSPS